MLRFGQVGARSGRETLVGRASHTGQVRNGRARNTGRKRVDRHLTRAFHGVFRKLGIWWQRPAPSGH